MSHEGRRASAHRPASPSDELAPIISWTLLVGVFASAILIAFGFLLYALSGSAAVPARPLSTIGAVVRGLLLLHPLAVIDSGLLLLILTPVTRVAIGVVGFWRERDPNMTAATSFVLLALILSFVLGKAGG